MSIKLNDSIRVSGSKPVEDKRMNNGTPYASVEEVNASIKPTDRYESLEVFILDKLYWYHGGTSDSNLIEKVSSGGTANALVIPFGTLIIHKAEGNIDMENLEIGDTISGLWSTDNYVIAKYFGGDKTDKNNYSFSLDSDFPPTP